MLTFMESCESYCEVLKVVPKLDSSGGGISWDVDVAYNVTCEDEAELLKSVFPSAVTSYLRAIDGKGDSLLKTTLPQQLFTVSFRTKGGDSIVKKAAAEVRGVEFKVNEKSQVYTAKMRLCHLRSEFYVDLVQSLGEFVVVSVTPQQQDLPLLPKTAAPEIGDVVVAECDGVEVYGVYRGEKYEEHIVEDFQKTYKAQKVLSSIKVEGASAPFDGDFGWYRTLVKNPTWQHVVLALSKHLGEGKVQLGANGYIVTNEIVSSALEYGDLNEEDNG
jgi:hypothetical protein